MTGPGGLDQRWEQLRAELRKAGDTTADQRRSSSAGSDRPVTSDLSIDEVLVLHSIGWDPVELVCGASVVSIPMGAWQWGVGEVVPASEAHARAVATAAQRLADECRSVGGRGVVGVEVDFEVERHHVNAVLVGTAVRPHGGSGRGGAERSFVSDLSARDFTLLHNAGWEPLGLAFGASFVHAPRRTAMTALQQKGQNVELTNYTEALYSTRESAMERMQSSALALGAGGVVAVQVTEGPMSFAHHSIAFTAWGTAVRAGAGGHRYLRPRVVVPLDDTAVGFAAQSLRGGG
jgi:uncharacterized protein YbjQ (UPF0145 family)